MAESTESKTLAEFAEGLSVTQTANGKGLSLTITFRHSADCILHWGLSHRPGGAWERPPESCWPQGTAPADGGAVRTPFGGDGRKEVRFHLDSSSRWRGLAFVVYSPQDHRWIKNGGKDFQVMLPRAEGRSPEEALSAWLGQQEATRQTFPLDSGDSLASAVQKTPQGMCVRLVCDAAGPLLLHWGLAWRGRHEWQAPPEDARPQGTTLADDRAASTPFTERDGLQYLELSFPKPAEGSGPRGLVFVLHQAEDGWLKSNGKDLFVPLFEPERDARLSASKIADLAEQIISAEMESGSWTLMHRFSLCHDLLDKARDDEDALALLFAWLRYSAIRQLDWQRNYNTKPRELSHAQERLTTRLANVWRGGTGVSPVGCRFWARQMFSTLGRGGDGQRVRDEILHIMHRNDLKEAAGNFIEEWHQKLHNNTTPDDVVICQAYLAFLRGNGDRATFYQTLEQGGVTRGRLQSFERPIKSEPTFSAGRKDALLGEFEHFLSILKSVHSGTDLDSAIAAARGRLDGGMNKQLDGLLALRGQPSNVAALSTAAVSARESLARAMAASNDDAALRDLLFLDLALEQCLRTAIERQNISELGQEELVKLVQSALRNLGLTVPELAICAAHWSALLALPHEGRDWALHARAVTDRAARWVQEFSSDISQRLQPVAEALGAEFHAEAWTISLFSEEVIRGGPAFTLSLLLRPLDRLLRQQAGMGGWQVISPARGGGKVRPVQRLLDVQSERFPEPTVLVADHVSGEEEIPEGATVVLTCDAPDLVSHVAVRARNAGVLFATCFDNEEYQRLKSFAGKPLSLAVTPSGDVEYQEGDVGWVKRSETHHDPDETRWVSLRSTHPTKWVIGSDEFKPDIVGGKSVNLNGLRGRLAEWIHLPKSIALPFGVFERVLSDERNRRVGDECQALIAAAADNPSEVLAQVRGKLLQLEPPPQLQEALHEQWQRAGLPPEPWPQTWHAIRRVWASKWNDRAFLSRRARGVPHDSLQMAVLIQEVVPADYAFVIHTVNPLSGERGEIFAEVVLGMGETLVGNYPGRALSFVCRKSDLEIELHSYPSKSLGIYGKGVIFRSDSNGEDLADFAGAGLYDSFLAQEPEQRRLDYHGEKLIWDAGFREELLHSIARIGVEVEQLLGSAQDIEGAIAGGRFHVVQTRAQVGLSKDGSNVA